MSEIQDRNFDRTKLNDYEAKLWREHSKESLSGFSQYLQLNGKSVESLHTVKSKLNVENSGIDNDSKRHSDHAFECWQTGFSTTKKKIDTLRQGGKSHFLQGRLSVHRYCLFDALWICCSF